MPKNDSTRKALAPRDDDHHSNSNKPKRMLRQRADSAGSTRGAFVANYTNEELEEKIRRPHHHHHHHHRPAESNRHSYQTMETAPNPPPSKPSPPSDPESEPILHGELLHQLYQNRPGPSRHISTATVGSGSESSMVYSSAGSIRVDNSTRVEERTSLGYDSLTYSVSMRNNSILPPLRNGIDLEANAQSSRLKNWLENSNNHGKRQDDEIAQFSSMANYGGTGHDSTTNNTYPSPIVSKSNVPPPPPPQPVPVDFGAKKQGPGLPSKLWTKLMELLDPTDWLLADIKYDEDDIPYFEQSSDYTLAGLVRWMLYNPEYPEFTSLQQINWAVLIGVFMGFYTAIWKWFINFCMLFLWVTVPTKLKTWGLFTDLNGYFPLPHYMWICPTIFGGLLAYIMVVVPTPIPGQNEWMKGLHARGVQGHETFWLIFFIATAGMASGLSLGPELPLILTGGMVGSYLGSITKQSILQARVLNLTAAGAAIGGFFGFPMAGAMFVLELPHRMGLQYFEALSPATIASIVAVLVNRMVTGNNITGYYQYPFLTNTLPSQMFSTAIVIGLVGGGLGICYAKGVMALKKYVHDLFHHHEPEAGEHAHEKEPTLHQGNRGEATPLVGGGTQNAEEKEQPGVLQSFAALSNRISSFGIKHEPTRMAVVGCLAGFVTGVICMFIPHILFWGEQQLQSLINKGRTPLPVFGRGNSPTADLTAYGFCMVDPSNPVEVSQGYSIGCEAVITVAKIFVTGLCLGTGIVGGHFWGPLFVAVIASHFFTDVVNIITNYIGFGHILIAYPCVTILCFMGSAHVVTFRAHLAIMLILTLTISAFNPLNSVSGNSSGDYSAVFPLLVVSVFVSLMISRNVVFYKEQRSRGDIMALPEVLCEPGKEGAPMVMNYGNGDDDEGFDGIFLDDDYDEDNEPFGSLDEDEASITADEIERAFQLTLSPQKSPKVISRTSSRESMGSRTPKERRLKDRLDELLAQPMENAVGSTTKSHRRIQSASAVESGGTSFRVKQQVERVEKHSRSGSGSMASERLVRVTSYGEVSGFQPSLMDQARKRASSLHRRIPSLPKAHSRKNSDSSAAIPSALMERAMDEVEHVFSSLMAQKPASFDSNGGLV